MIGGLMHIVLMQGGLTCRSKAVNALTNNLAMLVIIVFPIAAVRMQLAAINSSIHGLLMTCRMWIHLHYRIFVFSAGLKTALRHVP